MNYTRLEKQLQDSAFDFLKKIIQVTGAEIFLVGGAVRDFILERETKDYDFVVRGSAMSNGSKELVVGSW